jgi:hypothetical protein
MLIAVLGMGLFVWGRSAQTKQGAAIEDATQSTGAVASLDSSFSGAPVHKVASSEPLTLNAARQIVNTVSRGDTGDVRVVRTDRSKNQAVIAIHDEQRKGTSQLFVLEQRGGRYRVTGRASLDASDFRGADWTAESRDVDGDGYDEVMCTGTNAKGKASDYRLVLYVPRTHQTYAMRLENITRGSKPLRVTYSPNALTRAGARYRAALQQRARDLLAAAAL